MYYKASAFVPIITSAVISGCGVGEIGTGYGEDLDLGTTVTSTPFPDGHSHSILLLKCEDLMKNRDIVLAPAPFEDHNHSVPLTVAEQADITKGKRVVVQTNDIHPHNWPFDMHKRCD